MHKHILISEVVDQGICIGCGVCAGICPGKNIEMRWSDKGELNPYIDNGCAPEICTCISACPILNPLWENKTPVEPMLSNDVLGDYIASYNGYSTQGEQHINGTSGGVLTWLLSALLKERKIDGAIAVVESSNPTERLFEFKILESIEEIEAASGSKYYPVEISEIMRFLKKDKSSKRYALVGLPCLITGMRQAQQFNKHIDSKILYMFSLTCGQLPNRFYTEALASYSGISPATLASANYRSKEGTLNARNFIFHASDIHGNKGQSLSWDTKPWHLWKNSFFIHGACKICDDVFGKHADVVFMDAWLKHYSDDPKGHSLIVSKNKDLDTFITDKIQNGDVYLTPEPIDNILLSQKNVITKKTRNLSAHLYKLSQEGFRITPRRVAPDKNHYEMIKERINLEWKILNTSKERWKKLKDEGHEATFFTTIDDLNTKIHTLEAKEKRAQKLQKFTKNPLRILTNVLKHQLSKIKGHTS